MLKSENDPLESRLLTSILSRLQESYLHQASRPPSSPLILTYLNSGFTDGIYWIAAKLQGPVLTPSTAYRLLCWDVEVTEEGLVMEVLEAQFASNKVGNVGKATVVEHNPRVRELLHRIRYLKVADMIKQPRAVVLEPGYVFPQYALDFLKFLYNI